MVYGCFVYMYACAPCECLVSEEAREGVRCPKTRVTDGCELLCGCWKLNLGPLEKQPTQSHLSSLERMF